MAGSIIAAIVFAGASATVIAVATFAINLVLSTVLTKLLSPTPSGGGGGNAQDPGVQSRLPANPANKLGVVYGSAWIKGAVIHGENTNDYKTAYYAVALCENLGTASYPNSMTSVYWQEFRLTLDGNGWVTGATDASGASVSSFNNSIRVQYFADGLPADRSSLPNTTWFQTATNTMSGYACAVITVKYNRDQRIFQLEDMTFNITNNMVLPGYALEDYLTNTRYGCAISRDLVDTDGLLELNNYSSETVTFTPVGGGTASQPRYRFNGVVNTTDNCWNNLQNMAASCGCVIRIDNLTGKFGVFIDRAWTTAPVYAFDSTNIIGDSNITLAELTGSPNQLEVRYARGDNQFKGALDTQLFKLPSNLVPATAPVNQNTLTLPLCNNNIQAEVLAKLTINQYALDLGYTLRTDHRAIGIQSGDVISVTDTRKGWVAKLFRVLGTAEVERQDGFVDVEIVTKEYSDAVYVPGTLIQADPSPNITVPSPRALSGITPNTPRVTGTGLAEGQRYFDLTVDLPILNGMRVDFIEVYRANVYDYAVLPNLDQYQLLTTIKSNAIDGSFAIGESVTQTIYGLEKGDYVYVCKLFNTVAASYISLPSLIHQWDPQNTNIQRFDTSGTWTKPQGGQTQALIQIWGGGGGGGGSNNAGAITATVYATPGNYTYTVPNNVSELSFLAVGGGGRGGGDTPFGSGGGGAGGVAYNQRVSVSSFEVLNITVGVGANATTPAGATTITGNNFSITLNGGQDGINGQSIPGEGGTAIAIGNVFLGNNIAQGSSGVPGNYQGSGRGGKGGDGGLGFTDNISPLGGSGGAGGTTTQTGTAGEAASPGSGAGGGGGGFGSSIFQAGGDGGSGRVTIYPYSVSSVIITSSQTYTVGANTTNIEITAVGAGGAGGSVSDVFFDFQTTNFAGGFGGRSRGVLQTYDYYYAYGRDAVTGNPLIYRSTQASPTTTIDNTASLPLDFAPVRMANAETTTFLGFGNTNTFVSGIQGDMFSNTNYSTTLYRYVYTNNNWIPVTSSPYRTVSIHEGNNSSTFFATSLGTNAFAQQRTVIRSLNNGNTWSNVFTYFTVIENADERLPTIGWNGQYYYMAISVDPTPLNITGNRFTAVSGNTATFIVSNYRSGPYFIGGYLDITASGGNSNTLTIANAVITNFQPNVPNPNGVGGTARVTVDYGRNIVGANFALGVTLRPVQPVLTSPSGNANTWTSHYVGSNIYYTETIASPWNPVVNTNTNTIIIPVFTPNATSNVIVPGYLRSVGDANNWTFTSLANTAISNVSVPVRSNIANVFVSNGYIDLSQGSDAGGALSMFYVSTQNGRASTKTSQIIGPPGTLRHANGEAVTALYLSSYDDGNTWQLASPYYGRYIGVVNTWVLRENASNPTVISGPLAFSHGLRAHNADTFFNFASFNGGNGGNAGSTITQQLTVTPGSTINITVGAAGAANANLAANGASGGNTSYTVAGTTYTAVGGAGGRGGVFGSRVNFNTYGLGEDSSVGTGGKTPSQAGGTGAGGAGASAGQTVAGGAGGGGAVYIVESSSANGLGGGGGGGGGYLELNIALSELNSAEDIFVGAGGAADPGNIGGGRGGNSSVRNWVATGGFGGQYDGVGGAGGTNNFYDQPDWQGGRGGDGQVSGDGENSIKAGGGGGGGFGEAGQSIEGGNGGSGPLGDGQAPGGGGGGSNPSRGAGMGGSGAVVITSY